MKWGFQALSIDTSLLDAIMEEIARICGLNDKNSGFKIIRSSINSEISFTNKETS